MTRPFRAPDIRVSFLLSSFTGNGDTKTVRSGYRPTYMVHSDYWSSAHHEFIGTSEVNSGERSDADVWLLSPEAYPASFWSGRTVLVTEGACIVGTAEIVSVENPMLDAAASKRRFKTHIDVSPVNRGSSVPARMVCELDDNNRELRRLEFFHDGTVRSSDGAKQRYDPRATARSAILRDVENVHLRFVARGISAEQFETLWQRYSGCESER